MYHKTFGLCRRPFPATPDSNCYYPASAHEAALAQLLRALQDDDGLMLLTGAPGTGKSLLGQCLLERLEVQTTTAFVTNTHFDDCAAMLQAILYDLELPYEGSCQVLRLRLTDFLLHNCAEGKRTLLVLDEAHHLRAEHLEELRLLGNLEAGSGKAFQVVLLALPEILETLQLPRLQACSQRLMTRCSIGALALDEAIDYLLHHLRIAGGRSEAIIDDVALEILAQGTHGIPRLLNSAGHQAIKLAHQAELHKIDAEAALEALAILGLDSDSAAAHANGHGSKPVLDMPPHSAAAGAEGPGVRGRSAAHEVGSCRIFEAPRRPA